MVLQYYRRARVYISISPISSVRCQCSRAQQFGMSKVVQCRIAVDERSRWLVACRCVT